MSSFKENIVSVCQSLGTIAVPFLKIATATLAGKEASELVGIPPAVGVWAGLLLGIWPSIYKRTINLSSDEQSAQEDDNIDRPKDTIHQVEKNKEAFYHVNSSKENGFDTFVMGKN